MFGTRNTMNMASATRTAITVKSGMRMGSASQQARGAESERQQKDAERYRWRPRGAVKCRGDAFEHAEQHGGDQRAGHAAHPAEHANGEHATDIFTSDRGLDRLDDDEERARDCRHRNRDAESDALDADRIDRH